jgi:N-acyl-D-aspartate/D-glutamate deacylase
MSEKTLLRGGRIVDGSGAPSFDGDVLIDDGRIVEVGTGVDEAGCRVIDVDGLTVAPGFIDPHTHYDAQVMWDPLLRTSAQYGVTTVVIGHCGFTVAPVGFDNPEYLIQMLARVEGMPSAALEAGLSWSWRTFGEYLDEMDRPLGPNVISLVGHSSLRYSVMGDASYERAATDDEIADMQRSLRQALEAGAWGFTTATSKFDVDSAGRPVPSRLADPAEVEALADVLHAFPFGVIGHSPHSKVLGIARTPDDQLLSSMSLRGGAKVNWNNLAYSAALPDLWKDNLAASQHAADCGAQVYAIYNPGSNGIMRVDFDGLVLFGSFPNWSQLAIIDRPARIRAFMDPGVREKLWQDLHLTETLGLIATKMRTMWDSLRVTETFAAQNTAFLGRCVGDIGRDLGRLPLDVALDIAVADELRTTFILEDSLRTDADATAAFETMKDSPFVVFGGSDAGAHLDMMCNEGLPVRTIVERVRSQGSMTIEETVRGSTSAVAASVGLRDRGRLAPGMRADVVVFDLSDVDEGQPHVVRDLPGGSERLATTAQGVVWTIVNGDIVFERGEPTGSLPGRLLRSSTA